VNKVIAAIPSYNMLPQLLSLLPQLVEHQFDEIFVLDDNSSDGTVEEIRRRFTSVNVVSGKNNLGAAGNRNRILEVLDSHKSRDDVIVFIDADMELIGGSNIPKTVRQLFETHDQAGLIGGKVLNADGSWGAFNYGPLPLIRWMVASRFFQLRYEQLKSSEPTKVMALWRKHAEFLKDWPNPFNEAVAREVGWLVENFVFVKLGVFERVGGYDAKLRYCEALDLGDKLKQIGMSRVFDPVLCIKHLQIDQRGWHKSIEILKAVLYLAKKRIVSKVRHSSGI